MKSEIGLLVLGLAIPDASSRRETWLIAAAVWVVDEEIIV
jgi:hypothetical protein